jgi:dienelactone hydrolase
MPTVMDWVARHPVGSETVMATLAALISELRLVHGVTKVTTEGFCWGAGRLFTSTKLSKAMRLPCDTPTQAHSS